LIVVYNRDINIKPTNNRVRDIFLTIVTILEKQKQQHQIIEKKEKKETNTKNQ